VRFPKECVEGETVCSGGRKYQILSMGTVVYESGSQLNLVDTMTAAPHTFKYIDKDRMIPWIDAQLKNLNHHHQYLAALEEVKRNVEFGLFDWQPAE